MKDLVILVADKDMEMTMRGLLPRPQSLGIRAIQYDLYTHPQHDPGVRTHAAEFLRPYQKMYHNASKPENPKSAVEEIIRLKKIPRSSALFQRLAERVSLSRCTDRSFARLRETLKRWFPIHTGGTNEA